MATEADTNQGVEGLTSVGLVKNKHNNSPAMATSPINLNQLEIELRDYKEPDASVLLNGFRSGFSIHYSGPIKSMECKNLKSANQNPDIVRQKLAKELMEDRIAGPFKEAPFTNFRVSPIGLVEKKTKGEYRLIHHLSYPKGDSVNDFIDPELCSVQYTSFDQAIKLVQSLGTGCFLSKCDIKSAFRLLPVAKCDFKLLGFKFEDQYYYDRSMPFGCSISCSTFELFATFLEHCVRAKISIGDLLHYLDDFLMGGKEKPDCQHVLDTFKTCMEALCVPLADEKTEGPQQVIIFLGLELDSVLMQVRIPMQKIRDIIDKIDTMLSKAKTTLKKMQSLIGSLQFACRAIVPGRPFCRRLIKSICGLEKPHHHIRLNQGIREDLAMWRVFFEKFNGTSVFYDQFWSSNTDLQLYTDAAAGRGLGFGCYFHRRWSFGIWPESWHIQGITDDITILEFFPLLVSLYIWGTELRNKKITFNCDNQSVVEILNSRTSKSRRVMVLLRAFTLKCLELNILVKGSFIRGSRNIKADYISRLQFDKFSAVAPDAAELPSAVPTHLWNIFNLAPESY